jgi:hypothetical protein
MLRGYTYGFAIAGISNSKIRVKLYKNMQTIILPGKKFAKNMFAFQVGTLNVIT